MAIRRSVHGRIRTCRGSRRGPLISAEEVDGIRDEVRAYVDECAKKALDSPMPDPGLGTDGVYADEFEPLGDGNAPWSRWSRNGTGNGAAPAERRAA